MLLGLRAERVRRRDPMSLRARPPAPSSSSGLRSFRQGRCDAHCAPLLASLRDGLAAALDGAPASAGAAPSGLVVPTPRGVIFTRAGDPPERKGFPWLAPGRSTIRRQSAGSSSRPKKRWTGLLPTARTTTGPTGPPWPTRPGPASRPSWTIGATAL